MNIKKKSRSLLGPAGSKFRASLAAILFYVIICLHPEVSSFNVH